MTCIGLEINILPTFIFLETYQCSKVGVSEQVHAGGLFGICGFAVQATMCEDSSLDITLLAEIFLKECPIT